MPKKQYSIKIEEDLLEQLKKVAEKEMRSVNNAIEVAVRDYISKKSK